MTQAEIFRNGAIVVGEKLPETTGILTKVKVVEIEVRKSGASSLITDVIVALGEKPEHRLVKRAGQYRALLKAMFSEHQSVAVIVHQAHFLSSANIRYLKQLREINTGFGPEPCIILLGDINRLTPKVNAWNEISQRASIITKNGDLEPWPVPSDTMGDQD